MDYDYDTADILGSSEVPIVRDGRPRWSGTAKLVGVGAALLLLALAATHVRNTYKKWQEKNYRKALRRRHGIPDNDHRAFNVAYAAAVQARQEREVQAAKTATARPLPVLQEIGPEMRQRVTNTTLRDVLAESAETSGFRPDLAARLRTRSSATLVTPSYQSIEHRTPLADLAYNTNDSQPRSRKQSTNGITYPTRGSKRAARDDEDEQDTEEEEYRRVTADKRARKTSMQNLDVVDVSMDAEEEEQAEAEDELMDLVDTPERRGKKRDRAEAGSTIGGEEEEENERRAGSRHRKRRATRRSEAPSSTRGKKRDLELSDDDATMDSEDSRRLSTKRRSRGSTESNDMPTDAFDAPVSVDPLCGGRRIGEEWELHGTKFKVGPNGQRLRQELVKRVRPRFIMPKDSVHPDAVEDVEYFTEVWMSEEEYQAAKGRQELFWQSKREAAIVSPPASEPTFTPVPPVKPKPVEKKGGKELLWSSTLEGAPKLRIDPIQAAKALAPPASPASRRIGSSFNAGYGFTTPGASPRKSMLRGYSKWEKQDQEAEAMARMRQRILDERASAESAKAATAPSTATATITTTTPTMTAATSGPASGPAPPPAFTLPKPSEAAKIPTLSFSPSNAATTSKPQAQKADVFSANVSKPMEAPKPAEAVPTFKLPALPASATSDASKAPSTFSFGVTPPTPAAATPVPAVTTEKKPASFSFGSTPTATAPKPTEEKKEPAASTFSHGPSTTPAAAPATPALAATPVAQATPTPLFSFNTTAPSTTPAVPSPFGAPTSATAGPKPSAFGGFGAPAQPAAGEKKDNTPATNAFSRSSTPAAAEVPKSAAAPTPAPTFSFAKPAGTDAPKPISAFGAPAAAPAAGTTSAAATSAAPTASVPKFGFGVGLGRPSTSAAAPASTTPAVTEAPKSTFSSFGAPASSSPFGAPAASSSAPTPAAGTSTAVPSFSFGVNKPGSTPAAASTNAFGSSAFGASTPVTAPAATNSAAPTSFNFKTAKPTEAVKPATGFNFGTEAKPADAPKPASTFNFGTGTPSAGANGAAKPALSFNFGAQAGPSTPGTPSAPSPFGFGASTTTPAFGATAAPAFGARPAEGATPTSATATTPSFNFGASGAGSFTFGKK